MAARGVTDQLAAQLFITCFSKELLFLYCYGRLFNSLSFCFFTATGRKFEPSTGCRIDGLPVPNNVFTIHIPVPIKASWFGHSSVFLLSPSERISCSSCSHWVSQQKTCALVHSARRETLSGMRLCSAWTFLGSLHYGLRHKLVSGFAYKGVQPCL